MSRIYNFNAGPSTLPLPVLEAARDELVDFRDQGMSILEISHRSKAYEEVHYSAMNLMKRLFGLSDDFQVLFLQGGATMQFGMVPLNFLPADGSCDFVLSGRWAQKAYSDTVKQGRVEVLFDGADDNYVELPSPASLQVHSDAAYLHLTSNETVNGIQWQDWPHTGEVPIVCDMSSDLLSRRLPVERFGLIYAGAQKNVGPAGVTVVIIRRDMLERCADDLPAYLDYRTHAKKDSLYNTPPVFSIFMVEKVLRWLEDLGGLDAAEQMARERSTLVYSAIDQSDGFYRSPVAPASRSLMNVVFRLPSEELEARFIAEAAAAGLGGLKGHRSVGGCRASLYNAMPVEGARALASFMADFAQTHG